MLKRQCSHRSCRIRAGHRLQWHWFVVARCGVGAARDVDVIEVQTRHGEWHRSSKNSCRPTIDEVMDHNLCR